MMSKKILIVDDNEGDRKLIAEALSDAQVEVDLVDAQTGDEAIRLAQDEKPDLILMDAGMNGGDAVKLLKSDKRTDGIPIVFLTGMYSKGDEKAYGKININEEFYDSIAKPFDETKLITTINKYV
jgi:CheY-like chemotaxis protein